MILIAGGTGQLGGAVTGLLTARGLRTRILTRDPARARRLEGDLVEVTRGNARDQAAVERAVAGARIVISAIQGFSGTGEDSPRTVDWEGNRALIHAARASGVEHFILVSVHGAAPDHPMELFRMKRLAEDELRASDLAWTIVRPTAFMETWAALIGEPLVKTGRTRLFGRGENPINFVAVADVARFVEMAVIDPALRGEIIEVGGPENLTLRQVARTFKEVTGRTGTIGRIPLPMMRVMGALLGTVNPTIARQIKAGVVMDTHDMTFDSTEMSRRFPSVTPRRLAEVVASTYGASARVATG